MYDPAAEILRIELNAKHRTGEKLEQYEIDYLNALAETSTVGIITAAVIAGFVVLWTPWALIWYFPWWMAMAGMKQSAYHTFLSQRLNHTVKKATVPYKVYGGGERRRVRLPAEVAAVRRLRRARRQPTV